MKKIRGLRRLRKRLAAFAVALCTITLLLQPAYGETLSEIQKKKEEAQQQKNSMQNKLESVQSEINSIEEEREGAEAEIEEIDAELVDVILSIDILKDDITSKNNEIEEAQVEYDAAVEKEEQQKAAMKKRIKFMYEKGETSYLTILLESQSMAEAVNKRDYTEKLYEYDRVLLEEYQQTKQNVKDKKEALEVELSELEEIELNLVEQKDSLQAMIDERQEVLDNFDDKLAAAQKQANSYKSEIKQQANAIKQIEQQEAAKKAEEEAKRKAEEEARKKAEEAANNSSGSNSSGGSSSEGFSSDPGDASKGQQIANFACQFVGNPYVPGGTSLTEGCDCSGFTSSVYANFGISLPRSSYAQSAAGRAVSYSDVQPGDILYYGGHVGIYIGNNQIVHASTQATGIKISNASYRTVITIRRFV